MEKQRVKLVVELLLGDALVKLRAQRDLPTLSQKYCFLEATSSLWAGLYWLAQSAAGDVLAKNVSDIPFGIRTPQIEEELESITLHTLSEELRSVQACPVWEVAEFRRCLPLRLPP
jgi:hypothetical protein